MPRSVIVTHNDAFKYFITKKWANVWTGESTLSYLGITKQGEFLSQVQKCCTITNHNLNKNSSWNLVWYEEVATKSSITQPVNDVLHFCVLTPKSFSQAKSFWHSDVPCLYCPTHTGNKEILCTRVAAQAKVQWISGPHKCSTCMCHTLCSAVTASCYHHFL